MEGERPFYEGAMTKKDVWINYRLEGIGFSNGEVQPS